MFDKMIILAQAMPEGRVFGLDTQTLFSILIQLFNGILLAVVLSVIFYKPIKNFMQNRTNKIQGKAIYVKDKIIVHPQYILG